jgi:toxin CcdB
MAQFHVYRNPRPESKSRFPLLLDIQNDLIGSLETRVVVPLAPLSKSARPVTVLMPTVVVEGKGYVMCTPQLAGVPRAAIGAEVATLGEHRYEIIAALDLLITGFSPGSPTQSPAS